MEGILFPRGMVEGREGLKEYQARGGYGALLDAVRDPDVRVTLSEGMRASVRMYAADRDVFQAIATILKSARRSDSIELLQRNVIVLETRRQPAPSRRSRK